MYNHRLISLCLQGETLRHQVLKLVRLFKEKGKSDKQVLKLFSWKC